MASRYYLSHHWRSITKCQMKESPLASRSLTICWMAKVFTVAAAFCSPVQLGQATAASQRDLLTRLAVAANAVCILPLRNPQAGSGAICARLALTLHRT